ncbi:MAG: 23S rRNA (adenine(2503)-C(2))-methyltransferase RlmN [Chloroflexi bacterium]|nr:23S rRNA (adenine(2503)-C(2))-methyltransferase RlmN [Chloroflexota bacterium]
MKPRITDLTLAQLEDLVKSWRQPAYRARQIFKWLYRGLATSFEEMTDLPTGLRQTLASETTVLSLKPVDEVTTPDSMTTKVLFALDDGKTIESVLMLYDEAGEGQGRNTVCVSTQVGCPMDCPFCATGSQGFERNLTPGEIIEQALFFQRRLAKSSMGGDSNQSPHITNIVFMGMGEPLANYDAVCQAIAMFTAKDGLGLSPRRLTVSTCGLAPQIKRLAAEESPVELAVSLHAANNELRDRLVPVNRRFPLEMLMDAIREYYNKTGRRPTFEYILFRGINDSPQHACELARLLKGLNCHVNLIPANPTKEFVTPSPGQIARFQHELSSAGVSSTVRQSRGQNIQAACGQLRSRRKGF